MENVHDSAHFCTYSLKRHSCSDIVMDDQNGHAKNTLEEELLEPYRYIMKFRGKQTRAKMIHAFNHWLNVPRDKMNTIAESIYKIYVATLLMDDIQDDTQIRRGAPAAHCIYGTPLTINAAMHIFLLAFKKLSELNPMISNIYLTQSLEAIRGQGCDIYWREHAICPTEEQYKQMVEQKTGRLFSLPVQMMQLFSENKTDYSDLALLLGCYYQIRDDYCNLMKQEVLEEWVEKDKKEGRTETFCEDISEGKFTLPIIHAMQSPEAEKILNILRQKTRDLNLKKQCLVLLEKMGSLQYTRDVLAEFDRKARAEVARLGGNPELEAVLDNLLDWM